MHVCVCVKKHNTGLGLLVTWTIRARLVDQQTEICIVFDPIHTHTHTHVQQQYLKVNLKLN